MAKLTIKGYPVLELNRAAFIKTAKVEAQYQLDSDGKQVHNGTVVLVVPHENKVYPYEANFEKPALAGIVYTAERADDGRLKEFTNEDGDYPRVGLLEAGDVFTTNALATGEGLDNEEAMLDALANHKEAVVYAVAGEEGYWELTTTAPVDADVVAVVSKWYTMPDGQPGARLEVLRGGLI